MTLSQIPWLDMLQHGPYFCVCREKPSSKIRIYNSCKNTFRELGLLTLPCLYILEVVLYFRSKCNLVQGGDVHQYGTRGRDNFRVQQHRTATFERLPSEVGVKLINKLPEEIKQLNDQKNLKLD
ncbi:hypothetical protein J6590_093715 [Homalodisca vitripennis]|nr:hypothetical protein J6590_093715 [Homalodisca vitripennis]